MVPRRFLAVLSPARPGRSPTAVAARAGRRPLRRRRDAVGARDRQSRLVAALRRRSRDHPQRLRGPGRRPTHPELLDDLAARFLRTGWSLRWLHREIVLSATYRQGACAERRSMRRSRESLALAMTRRRLEVEAWRDAMLAVSGALDRKRGGPARFPGPTRRTTAARSTGWSSGESCTISCGSRFPRPDRHSPPRADPRPCNNSIRSTARSCSSRRRRPREPPDKPTARRRETPAFAEPTCLLFGRPRPGGTGCAGSRVPGAAASETANGGTIRPGAAGAAMSSCSSTDESA